jgi:2-keto-4-pentenoate hydratase/2-oxohepta-3-ene-1,7-dioic acid hydratase in catechol pathway
VSTRLNNIFCIGRNYTEHAQELGNAVPKSPIVFLKPTGALVYSPKVWELPRGIGQVDYEAEIVVRVGMATENVAEADAWYVVDSLGVGIDFTARDLQAEAKSRGLPWLDSKGRKGFAPVSNFIPLADSGRGPFELSLSVNGSVRQSASSDAQIFSIPVLLSYLAKHYGLRAGDLIFTGTPAGVGPVERGDRLVATMISSNPAVRAVLDFNVT